MPRRESEPRPWIVTDGASLWDIVSDNEDDVIERCWRHYGVRLGPPEFRLRLWRLVDLLESRRTRGHLLPPSA